MKEGAFYLTWILFTPQAISWMHDISRWVNIWADLAVGLTRKNFSP